MPCNIKDKKWINAKIELKIKQNKHKKYKEEHLKLEEKIKMNKAFIKKQDKRITSGEMLTQIEKQELSKLKNRTPGDVSYLYHLTKKVNRTK
jgi:hypothetical protein